MKWGKNTLPWSRPSEWSVVHIHVMSPFVPVGSAAASMAMKARSEAAALDRSPTLPGAAGPGGSAGRAFQAGPDRTVPD